MHKKKITLRSRLLSFKYAFEGLYYLVKNEPNVWLHIAATISVIVLGFIRHLHAMQWVAITVAIAIVWITEALNTAIELFCDKFCEGKYDPQIKIIKDVSAAAVLLAAVMSVVIAGCVFLC